MINREVIKLQTVVLSLLVMVFSVIGQAGERVTYMHNDALGSVVASTDDYGQVLWSEEYEAYGKRKLKEDFGDNEVWFTGKQELAAVDLQYFGARWYDPDLGIFISQDPVGVSGDNPYSFNKYTYANNNPYKYVDPDGKFAIFFILPFVGGTTSISGSTILAGTAITGAALFLTGPSSENNVYNESTPNTDAEVGGLTEGLSPETDSKGREKKGQFVNPEGNAADALGGLTGESDGAGGKILPDGSRAGVHTSSGTTGGAAGENTGSETLHVNRPKGKRDIKVRFPNSGG